MKRKHSSFTQVVLAARYSAANSRLRVTGEAVDNHTPQRMSCMQIGAQRGQEAEGVAQSGQGLPHKHKNPTSISSVPHHSLKAMGGGPGEMAQLLRAMAALQRPTFNSQYPCGD